MTPDLTKSQFKLASYVSLAVKQSNEKAWKQLFVPIAEVHRRINSFFANEKLTSILLDIHKKFLKIWAPWIQYAHTAMSPVSYALL